MNTNKLILAAAFAGTLALSAAVEAVTCPGPDVFGTKCTDNPTGCADQTTTSTDFISGDDTCVTRNIGFTFKYYGVSYTTVGVSDNGYLRLGGCSGSDFSNDCPVPSAATPHQSLYGVWDDIQGANGAVTDGNTGSSPNQIYTVDYSGMTHFSFGGSASWQIQLHENAGNGEMARVRIRTAPASNWSFTTGTENATSTDGLNKQCNTTISVPQCTEFSKSAGPTTGSCDLSPIEAKLDDGTRFTSDGERTAQTTAITSRLDDGTRFTSDVERNAQTAALQATLALLEAKLDKLEDPFPRETQKNLADKTCLPVMYMPASLGGRAEQTLSELDDLIASASNLGCPDDATLDKAQCYVDKARALLAAAPPMDCAEYCHLILRAYETIVGSGGGIGSCE